MKCPACTVDLQIMDRQGIEIDHCPQCRGVWLDRGELDKLIERSTGWTGPGRAGPARHGNDDHHERGRHLDRDDHEYEHGHQAKRRESFLGDLFDWG